MNKAPKGEDVREFAFSSSDFEQVRRLLYQRAGISLSDSKQQLVYSRLARRLRLLGMTNFADYLAYLQGEPGEFEPFINALTTNLTSFFREAHHFDVLAHSVRQWLPLERPLKIWCAAASTGEEPYSIAITLAEAFGSDRPPVRILASDIDSDVLRQAQAGVYPLNRVEALSPERKQRFLLRGKDSNQGLVKVRPELQSLVQFRQINLLDDDWDIKGPLDAIFCRNVMIYFDKSTQRRLLGRMAALLSPEGLYFAGHSESFVHAAEVVKLVGHSVYRLAQKAGAP